MDDLISRQAAIEHIEAEYQAWGDEYDVRQILGDLEDFPSAQQEVIRCKDCKWYGRVDKRRLYRGMDCLQKHIDTIVPDRDFCSKAERKDDD